MNTNEHGEVNDPFDLARFVVAQEDCFEVALGELRRGFKASHWMWLTASRQFRTIDTKKQFLISLSAN
jgi:uncharacterized protein (DUF1810 family)